MSSGEDTRFVRALGSELRELRRDCGLKQDQVDERAVMSKYMVSKIEGGHRSGYVVVFLWRLSRGLGVPFAGVVDTAVRALARRDAVARTRLAPHWGLAPRRR